MNPAERTDCPSCKRPVMLSYVPTKDDTLQDYWACPHQDCRQRHPSTRTGHLVIAISANTPES